jgi:hypothetical protein
VLHVLNEDAQQQTPACCVAAVISQRLSGRMPCVVALIAALKTAEIGCQKTAFAWLESWSILLL